MGVHAEGFSRVEDPVSHVPSELGPASEVESSLDTSLGSSVPGRTPAEKQGNGGH